MFSKIIKSPNNRSQLSLILFCVLAGLEGMIISILFNKIPGQTGGFLSGFSIKRMVIPIGMLLFSVGLLVVGWFVFFKPKYAGKWISWLMNPVRIQIMTFGTAFTFFFSWVVVLGWNSMLEQIFVKYSPIYTPFCYGHYCSVSKQVCFCCC